MKKGKKIDMQDLKRILFPAGVKGKIELMKTSGSGSMAHYQTSEGLNIL
ncbi:MAG: hypothetical protein ACHQ0Y_05345 [Thermodesulfovibrionales bacterium]